MDNIVLFNNGKVKKLKNKKYKKSKVDGIIISCNSDLFGRLYRFLPVHTYKKIHKCKSCSFRYDFIDGSVIDDDDVDEYIVRNKCYFDNGEGLVTKLDEIYITENILNDMFWVHDAYYSYLFLNYKFKFTLGNYVYKLKSVSDVYKILGFDRRYVKFRECFLNKVICIDDDKFKTYKNINSKKLKNNLSKSAVYLVQLYADLYIEVDYKFIRDIKQLYLTTDAYELDETGNYMYEDKEESKFNSYDLEYVRNKDTRLSTLFEHTLWKSVVESLGSRYYGYKIKTKLKEINHKRSKISLKKFLDKYFKNWR